MDTALQDFTVARTRAFAVKHHGTQTDKNKRPYVTHLDAVAANALRMFGFEKDLIQVAYLHDVVEDTKVTTAQIEALFGEDIAISVDTISKRHNEANYDYISAVLEDDIASRVKLADLYHNTEPDRLAELAQDAQRRLRKKYFPAIYRLETALDVTPTVTRDQAIEALRTPAFTGNSWVKMSAAALREGDRIRFSENSDEHLVTKKVIFDAKGARKVRIETAEGKHFSLLSAFKVQYRPGSFITETEIAKYLGEYVKPAAPTAASLAAAGVKS